MLNRSSTKQVHSVISIEDDLRIVYLEKSDLKALTDQANKTLQLFRPVNFH